MMRGFVTGSFLGLAALLGACSQAPRQAPRQAALPPLYVPSTAIAQAANATTGQLAINPYQILPSSDADTLFVGRPEKFAYGTTTFAESTAYSIFTYDQQLISVIGGPSYRYRWLEQNGVTSP